ncbi:hypothetical protein [Ralstonia pseudosolanacearum]|uniref:hypothetical protein n=1 Tax=Ralstonia pseudosolanacearum TaxID=1310165 RepID=UPI001E38FB23|nr:hypothetical protein [Ralstonia pseudosolanacearum]
MFTQHPWPDSGTRRATGRLIGFADAYGRELGGAEFSKLRRTVRGLQVVGSERFARTDASVTGQILKLMARPARCHPDRRRRHAGPPLPQRTLVERGLQGRAFYQTHGIRQHRIS